jgi:PAS domain S-box-containing protein
MNFLASEHASCSALDANRAEGVDIGKLWLYERALAATSCGIVISDARSFDQPILYCNQAFLNITGYDREEVIGQNCRFLQGADTDRQAVEKIRQAVRNGREVQVTLKNYRKDGSYFWNDLAISPVRDASGVITHFIGIQTDITERKQAEEAQQLMQFSIDRTADAVFYIRPDGAFFYVNEAASQALGYSQEELRSLHIWDIDSDFSVETWQSHWQDIKERGSVQLETQHRTQKGQVFPVEITFNYLKFNTQEYSCAFVRNISERKKTEAALCRSQELYRTLAKNFPHGAVLLFDRQLRHLIAEGGELNDVGLSKQALEGKTLWESFGPEISTSLEPAYRAALAGESRSFECSFRERIYLVHTLPVTNEEGEIFAGMVMTQNITERKQAEWNLQRTNALLKAQNEAALDGILVIDEKRDITSFNQRFCEMWQIPEQVSNSGEQRSIFNWVLPLIQEPQKVFSRVEYLEENPTLVSREEIYLTNGRVFDCYSAPVIAPNGQYYGRIWSFRDITEGKHNEVRFRLQAERERLVSGINLRIRQSLNLNEVLNTAVEEVRQFLACDRTLICQFNPDGSATIVVESVGVQWTAALGRTIMDQCFRDGKAELYRRGRISAVTDIYNTDLTPCHIQLLEQFQVRANLVVPIVLDDQLWGLLIAHQCSGTRHWKDSTVALLRQMSVQLSVAIQRAGLFEQLATELAERKAAEAELRKSKETLKRQASQLKKALKELKQAQIQLIQTEKMSSLGQLVAGVAHEINNPVTFISGNITHAEIYAHDLLELMRLYAEHYSSPVPEIEEYIEAIDFDFLEADFPKLLNSMKIGANRIRQIVLSLKNFSRLDEAERKFVNIHEGIENTLLILQHRLKPEASNIKLIKEYGEIPLVECYPGQLNQVFMNLLNNAIDALEKSDSEHQTTANQSEPKMIKITTAVVEGSQTHDTQSDALEGLKRLVIRIFDNGPGIAKEIKKRIFDPFFTTKPVGEGTGLGLSISYQIVVEKHGGQLQCFSEPGQGTEFVVEIPLTFPNLQGKESKQFT